MGDKKLEVEEHRRAGRMVQHDEALMSLNLDIFETQYQAYARKMPEVGSVIDEKSGETYHAAKN